MNRLVEMTPYRAGLLVSIGATDAQFAHAVSALPGGKEKLSEMRNLSLKNAMHAQFWGFPSGDGIIRMANLKSVHDEGRLVHELLHAVGHLFRTRGMPLGEDSEEAYTYLIQYLYETIRFMKP